VSWVHDRPWIAAAALAVGLAVVAGIGIGAVTAGSESEAEAAREQAFELAYGPSLTGTRRAALARGLREGQRIGRLEGRSTGSVEGFDLGGGVAGLDQISAQVAEAESARYAAEAELADRQANCGAIARAPDICPTSAELADFRAAVAEKKKAEEEAKKPDKPGGGQGQGPGQEAANGDG
jgi:hypothetical protein